MKKVIKIQLHKTIFHRHSQNPELKRRMKKIKLRKQKWRTISIGREEIKYQIKFNPCSSEEMRGDGCSLHPGDSPNSVHGRQAGCRVSQGWLYNTMLEVASVSLSLRPPRPFRGFYNFTVHTQEESTKSVIVLIFICDKLPQTTRDEETNRKLSCKS